MHTHGMRNVNTHVYQKADPVGKYSYAMMGGYVGVRPRIVNVRAAERLQESM